MQVVKYIFFLGIILMSRQQAGAQNFGWAGQIGGTTTNPNSFQTFGSVNDPAGNIYMVGGFPGTVDFDPGAGVSNLTAVNPSLGGEDIFIMKVSPGGSLLWVKSIGSTQIDMARGITYNPNGFIDIFGDFRGRTDFDPGIDTAFLTPGTANADLFILRLDTEGKFVHVNRVASSISSTGYINCVAADNAGNTIVGFQFNGTLDFDLGPSVFNLTSNILDIAICKYAPDGSFVWAKLFAGSYDYDAATSIAFDKDNNIVVGGWFSQTVDFDPGPNIFNLTSNGSSDGFVTKLNPAGNMIWAKSFRNTGSLSVSNTTVDTAGDIYCCGNYIGPADFDPGAGSFLLNSDVNDNFVVKLQSNGNFVWAKKFGITGTNSGRSFLLFDKDGILNISLNFSGSIDTDPGNGVFTFNSNGDTDIALIRLTQNGLFESARRIGGTLYESIATGCIDVNGNIFYAGSFQGNVDFDPGPGISALTSTSSGSNSTIFLLRLSGLNYVKGSTYRDINADGIKQSNEPLLTNVLMKATRNSLDYYGISDTTGNYKIEVDTGSYIITPKLPLYYTSILPVNHTALFGNQTGQTDTANHFGLVAATLTNDVRLSLTNIGPARPGFFSIYRLTYENVGTLVTSGNVVFTSDPQLTFVNATPATSGTTSPFTWAFSNLAPSETRNIDVVLRVSPQAVPGTYLSFYGKLNTTTADFNPFDNIDSLRHLITASFDPNDKKVIPEGAINPSFLSKGQYLDYTIRFQNTGTDTAFTVILKDTLSSNLDMSSLKMISASHPYYLDLKKSNYIEWHFNNILLPDSNINEARSHGFVRFKIKPKSSLVPGNEIKNKAAIYFDFNVPVITNETKTIVVVDSSSTSPVTGPDVKIYPNPAAAGMTLILETKGVFDYSIIDAAGRLLILGKRNTDRAEVKTSTFPKGIYFVRMETENGSTVRKIIIQ